MDFSSWMSAIQARTENALERYLPPLSLPPTRLHEAMRYAALGGGKRVRPLLAHAAGTLVGATPAQLDAAGCSVELIHVYSLVHDDLPCMDDDVLRRGKPTCHVEFDEATAMLVGDALQSLAFSVISEPGLIDDSSRQLEMLQLLARAAGSRGMAGGQAIDLSATGQGLGIEELEFMHIHKTGALIRSSVILGALCAAKIDESTRLRLDQYAKRIGLLFQVVDDILDTAADTATLGKTAGKDAAQHKSTYVSLLGIQGARALTAELLDEAKAALEGLGDGARRLREIADYIVARRF
jgi:farnesyl diphosphate synthase